MSSTKSSIKVVSKQDLQTIQKLKEIKQKTDKINENRQIKEQNKPKKSTFTAKNYLKSTKNYVERPKPNGKVITKTEPHDDYQEYKEGIKGIFYDCLCLIEKNTEKKGRLRDKLIESKDIKKIISKRLGYFNYFENDLVILVLTILSKWLEVKTSTCTATSLTTSAVANE